MLPQELEQINPRKNQQQINLAPQKNETTKTKNTKKNGNLRFSPVSCHHQSTQNQQTGRARHGQMCFLLSLEKYRSFDRCRRGVVQIWKFLILRCQCFIGK